MSDPAEEIGPIPQLLCLRKMKARKQRERRKKFAFFYSIDNSQLSETSKLQSARHESKRAERRLGIMYLFTREERGRACAKIL